MDEQKNGKINARQNNNVKKQETQKSPSEFALYAKLEASKMNRNKHN